MNNINLNCESQASSLFEIQATCQSFAYIIKFCKYTLEKIYLQITSKIVAVTWPENKRYRKILSKSIKSMFWNLLWLIVNDLNSTITVLYVSAFLGPNA